jgi:hypothetical protein
MRSIALFFAVAACLVMAVPTAAQDCGGCGAGCGPKAGGCKTCELVCGTAASEVVCFSCKCESFCLPLPGCGLFSLFTKKRCGSGCGEGCQPGGEPAQCDVACDDDCGACSGKPPVCGKARTRKKLFMRVVTVQAPAYDCVVGGCGDGCGDDRVPAEPAPGPVPPAPAPEAHAYGLPPMPLPR